MYPRLSLLLVALLTSPRLVGQPSLDPDPGPYPVPESRLARMTSTATLNPQSQQWELSAEVYEPGNSHGTAFQYFGQRAVGAAEWSPALPLSTAPPTINLIQAWNTPSLERVLNSAGLPPGVRFTSGSMQFRQMYKARGDRTEWAAPVVTFYTATRAPYTPEQFVQFLIASGLFSPMEAGQYVGAFVALDPNGITPDQHQRARDASGGELHVRIAFTGSVEVTAGPVAVKGKVEFEVEGSAEALLEAARDAWEFFKDVMRDLGQFMKKTWENIGFGHG